MRDPPYGTVEFPLPFPVGPYLPLPLPLCGLGIRRPRASKYPVSFELYEVLDIPLRLCLPLALVFPPFV